MSLSPATLLVRIVAVPAIATIAAVSGAITSSWWTAALMAFGGALLFTAFSERVLRGKLMGKIGKDMMTWYLVHLVGETIAIAAIGMLFSLLFGVAIASSSFWLFAAATWLFLCFEMVSSLLRLLPMWLATRGGPPKNK